MDSINREQSGDHRQDLRGADAIAKIKELAGKAHTCFFCTEVLSPGSSGARPMSVQKVDDDGNLWFLSADDSHKNDELAKNPDVQLYFQGSAHADFMTLRGTATISRDREKIQELWEPIVKNWFTEGVDDPRITVIRVAPRTGYYWNTKHGKAVVVAKMLIGAALGKTMDDSVEGTLQL